MKIAAILILLMSVASGVNGKETVYVGSTPAHAVVRSFLGIPLSDSIDFIKWRLIIGAHNYSLHCQFGVGQPNTDGFINGGKTIELTGKLRQENKYYLIQSGNRTLPLLALNPDLLHFCNKDKSPLIGNGGWSYTINAEKPSNSHQVNIVSKSGSLSDSVAFEGRTPCSKFTGVNPRPCCIKMKWLVILYANSKTNRPTTYHLNGNYRGEGGVRGNWKIIKGKDGRIIYQLIPAKGSESTYLLKLNENILVFTDPRGRLLVGDKNFSYTLSRRW